MSRPSTRLLGGTLLALALLITWWNHFNNGFHFDDFHTITDNPYVQSLRHVPRFFNDATTFSTNPLNRTWRPVISTSLAVDWWMGGGSVFWFHLSTFAWYCVLLYFLFHLYRLALEQGLPGRGNELLALYAVAVFALHPVSAETVNYIIQRADLYVTLGVTASLALYGWKPSWRRTGVYLLPFIAAGLSKPTALVMPLLLGSWYFWFEGDAETGASAGVQDGREREAPERDEWPRATRWRPTTSRVLHATIAALPSLAVALALALLHSRMTPATYAYGGSSPFAYRITQPFVALHYLRSLFWPSLTVDTDWEPFQSATDPRALLGFAFLALVVLAIGLCSRRVSTRPVAFGLTWFVVTLLPTSLAPLAEVTNDHRMFFPFVGLTLACCHAGYLMVRRILESPRRKWMIVGPALVALAALSMGTIERNRVWHTEESLWADAAVKSPKSGRVLMNYGLTQMRKGEYPAALRLFEQAAQYTNRYATLEVNLGVVCGAMGHDAEAERHFARALALGPGTFETAYYYAVWLEQRGRTCDARELLIRSLGAVPSDARARELMMRLLSVQPDWEGVRRQIDRTLADTPTDPVALRYSSLMRRTCVEAVESAEKAARDSSEPGRWLDLSLAYHQAGRFRDAVQAARRALELRPGYPAAWNNISAGLAGLGDWDRAIDAAQRALSLDPGMELARNNLAYAKMKKNQARKGSSNSR